MSLTQPVILQIIPELGPGGAEQGTIDIAAALVQAGSRALVCSQGGSRLHDLKRVGAEHIDLPVKSKNPLTIFANIKKIRKVIDQEGVDIVHVRSRAPAWSAYHAVKDSSADLVTTFHAPYNIGSKLKQIYNGIMAKGERVIAISQYVEHYIHNNYVVDPSNVRLIHRGVNIERFHPSKVIAERMVKLSKEWRIPDGAPVVMLPGRLTRWKGHIEFLEAIQKLGREDIFVVLVGADQGRKAYKKEIEQTIKDRGLEEQVRIARNCDDMAAAYMLANVVVSASIEPEGFGRVPIEAQAMGRPIVATDHGGATETVLKGETGWLVPPKDAKAMAEAIEQSLGLSFEARDMLAAKAIQHIHQNFTRDLMCDRTLDVYAELLRKKYADQLAAAEQAQNVA